MPRCEWCTEDAVEQVEIQAGAYKIVREPGGRTARRWTRKPVMAWACGRHRGLTLDERFVEPRRARADDSGQGSLL